jgi:predicted HTH domain antitoxin
VRRTIATTQEKDMTDTLRIELPVDGLPTAAELPDNFADEARFLLAVKLFELGRVSSGKAGRLCSMGRVEFLLAASRSGVPVVDLNGDELTEEFA